MPVVSSAPQVRCSFHLPCLSVRTLYPPTSSCSARIAQRQSFINASQFAGQCAADKFQLYYRCHDQLSLSYLGNHVKWSQDRCANGLPHSPDLSTLNFMLHGEYLKSSQGHGRRGVGGRGSQDPRTFEGRGNDTQKFGYFSIFLTYTIYAFSTFSK